jgi:glycerol kinase
VNTGERIVHSQSGLLTSVGWRLGERTTYVLEGSVFIAGAAVQWLRDGLTLVRSAPEIEALARSVPDSGGVAFVPALSGLGAPHWDMDARGLICGIDRGTTAGHLARATLEGIAFQARDVFAAMEEDLGRRLSDVRVDGGATTNDLLMQFQADVLQAPIVRPAMIQTTALGSALMAGLAVGLWDGLDGIRAAWQAERRFEPQMDAAAAAEHLARWRAAVARARHRG